MLTDESRLLYRYREGAETTAVSVYPAAVVPQSNAPELAVAPSALPGGVAFTVRSTGESAYFWNAPTSKHFAEIFITITAVAKAAFRAVKRFVRCTLGNIRMSLTLRKTVCLRL